MVLRHESGGCRYLGSDDRCTIYNHRPLGCRIFPFDPTFKEDGKLHRLKLIQATDCLYELDGENDLGKVQVLHGRHIAATSAYQAKGGSLERAPERAQKPGQKSANRGRFFRLPGCLSGPGPSLGRSGLSLPPAAVLRRHESGSQCRPKCSLSAPTPRRRTAGTAA